MNMNSWCPWLSEEEMISLLSNFTLNEEQEIRLKYDSIGMTVDMGENEYGEHSQLEALNKLSTGQLIVTNSYSFFVFFLICTF